MRSLKEVKHRAGALRSELLVAGCELKHSDALELISRIDGHANWNVYSAFIKNNLEIAELYLDEMLEAEKLLDFDKWIQRREQKYLGNSNERAFRHEMYSFRENYGDYVRREYLGSTPGYENSALEHRYPKAVRHLWRGIFEKKETLITCGFYQKHGTYYVNEFVYH